MISIEVKDADDKPLAAFFIYPMPAATFVDQFQALRRNIGTLFPARYIFLVASDLTYGWKGASKVPDFEARTIDLLQPYQSHSDRLEGHGELYLSGLVRRWITDLITPYRGRRRPPKASDLKNIGLLAKLREHASIGLR